MPRKLLPSVELLHQLLDYNPTTGELRWRIRDETVCADPRVRASFNTQFGGEIAGNLKKGKYVEIQISGYGVFLAHRIVWKMHYKTEPPEIMDHVDGDGRNNRLENLREANIMQNGWNAKRGARNKSGYKGVSFNTERQMWRAAIHVSKKTRLIGYFSTPEAAGLAYQKEAARLHGEFYARNLKNEK